MLVQDKPEDLKSTNALDDIEDPDAPPPAVNERAEIFLSGAHVATLDDAPRGLERVTLMVELEVTEESLRFNENGNEIPIRRCRRVGDMWIPGTQRPPTKEEVAAEQAAAKAKAAREQADREEAERAEQEHNEPPMFDEDGNPVDPDAPQPPDSDDVDELTDAELSYSDGQGDGDDTGSNVVQFSDGKSR